MTPAATLALETMNDHDLLSWIKTLQAKFVAGIASASERAELNFAIEVWNTRN